MARTDPRYLLPWQDYPQKLTDRLREAANGTCTVYYDNHQLAQSFCIRMRHMQSGLRHESNAGAPADLADAARSVKWSQPTACDQGWKVTGSRRPEKKSASVDELIAAMRTA